MKSERFQTTFRRIDTHGSIAIPFDPNEVWGARDPHHVGGTIGDHFVRGNLEAHSTGYRLPLGPSWVRDHEELLDGMVVDVVLEPWGHQIDSISPDIAAALIAEPQARAFFESVAPFYRNNTIRWIESAKRPETRRARIAETVIRLKAGVKQR